MRNGAKQNYSSLFEGMNLRGNRLGLTIREREGEFVLRMGDGEVVGGRQVLERVRDGLLNNGGFQRLIEIKI